MSNIPRIEKLRMKMREEDWDAFFVDDSVNLFYFTGQTLSAGKLIVTFDDVFLIVDGRYYEACRTASSFSVLRAEEVSLSALLMKVKRIGFDAAVMTHQQFIDLQKLAPHTDWQAKGGLLQRLRAIKEPEELDALRLSADYAKRGITFIQDYMRDGVTEKELSTALEIFWIEQGCQGVSFEPIIAVGSHSAMPHYRAGNGVVTPGTHVLCDIGVRVHHYHSDLTRIIPRGIVDVKIREIEENVCEAYLRAEKICKAGTRIGDLDRAARSYIADKGYGDFFTHSLGHGVGLEIHEFPLIRDRVPYRDLLLEAGMVITIEPGIYLPGIGGVRYENTLIIHQDSCEVIT